MDEHLFGNQQFCVGEMWKGPKEYAEGDRGYNASWQDALKDWSDRSRCTVFDWVATRCLICKDAPLPLSATRNAKDFS
ncbi:hypothetical protein ACYZT3_09915 [Pseudomonas sp. MDT1-16]|uniref:hypothetical protein n=1 Tax=Pseudomonas sp. AL03 TaxID=3042230 RepID=UPI00249A718B|nr:hypothetical protein [Pseudomonas sp. AL03]MDI3273769.1 hypothetical protein [Pseudomonas sp. AL03]